MHSKIALMLVAIGLIGIASLKVFEKYQSDADQASTSDSGNLKGIVRIGIDGWAGYFPLCSKKMRKTLYKKGYGLNCIDDQANYSERFKKLKKGDYHFAVGTIDSYVLNGKHYDYPGPIVAVIDESKGGDAVLARKSKAPTLDSLKGRKELAIAYTPDSPSHHLAKALSSHFDIDFIKQKRNQIETNGSFEAYKELIKGNADVAILWEPDVSKALEDENIVRLLGTEDTQQLIVDILIGSQEVVKSNPDLVMTFLICYFKTLKFYRDNKKVLVRDMIDELNVKPNQADTILGGIQWATLSDNAGRWFGVDGAGFSEEALIESIDSSIDILMDNRDFKGNPLPNEDPYRLINSTFVDRLYKMLLVGNGFKSNNGYGSSEQFKALSSDEWDKLVGVASLKSRKIGFASGASNLLPEGKQMIDELISDLKHYPAFRVEVRGHTGVRGNKAANQELSQDRADAVVKYIQVTYGIEASRMRAVGFGGDKPLPKLTHESRRSWAYRLPRVEISLVREAL